MTGECGDFVKGMTMKRRLCFGAEVQNNSSQARGGIQKRASHWKSLGAFVDSMDYLELMQVQASVIRRTGHS